MRARERSDERVLLSVARKEGGKGYDVFVRDGTQESIENALAMAIKGFFDIMRSAGADDVTILRRIIFCARVGVGVANFKTGCSRAVGAFVSEIPDQGTEAF